MNQFVFLYPLPEYIHSIVRRGTSGWKCPDWEAKWYPVFAGLSEEEREKFRDVAIQEKRALFYSHYVGIVNQSIDERYRQKGFGINWVNFLRNYFLAEGMDIRWSKDRVLETEIDFATHNRRRPDDTYLYPNPDFVLDQLGDAAKLVVGGFHMWDCVEKFARRAYERGLDVLVDEDLTELLASRLREPEFRTDQYPTHNPRKEGQEPFDKFMKIRATRPWLWQNY